MNFGINFGRKAEFEANPESNIENLDEKIEKEVIQFEENIEAGRVALVGIGGQEKLMEKVSNLTPKEQTDLAAKYAIVGSLVAFITAVGAVVANHPEVMEAINKLIHQ